MWRRWLLRIVALCLPFAVLGCLEGVLRWGEFGHDVRLVVPVAGEPLALRSQLNPFAGKAYWANGYLQGPESRRFDLPKPEGVYRIIAFGESTLASFPYPPELTFPRQLELDLQSQAPHRRFEVLNAGITAVASPCVADLVAQAAAAEPDLIIVHTGHNEFYGIGGVASHQPLFTWQSRARRLRLVQLFDPPPQPNQKLVQTLPRIQEIRWGDPLMERAAAEYRKQLESMVAAARRARIPILLVPMACNLRDQSPIRSLPGPQVTEEERARWKRLFDEAEGLRTRGAWPEALERFQTAEQIDAEPAILAYRQGQCLLELGAVRDAKAAFERARDLDACRWRAPGVYRDIVLSVAQADSAHVACLDLPEELARRSPTGVPGGELFLEQVHYTFEGHGAVARILAEFICLNILHEPVDADRWPTSEVRRAALGVSPADLLFGLELSRIMVSEPPFDAAPDAGLRARELQRQFDGFSDDDRQDYQDLRLNYLGADVLGLLARQRQLAQNLSASVRLARQNVLRRPWDAVTHREYGRFLHLTGDSAAALREIQTALRLAPHDKPSRFLLQALQAAGAADGRASRE